ncbi:hypothetical protein BACI349Y_450068 [Bacillus sp. 349Y]|nr:hypothetical protein BACI349Y_450068 [Bacillus sp. 349Y]
MPLRPTHHESVFLFVIGVKIGRGWDKSVLLTVKPERISLLSGKFIRVIKLFFDHLYVLVYSG